jgi:hypothetical protein
MPPSGIVTSAGSIRQYFSEAVRNALELLRFQPNQETSTYLVELLCEYARTAAATCDRPLALVMAEAQLADPQSSIRGLKQVGDHSLVLTGYFSASLVGQKLDPTYFMVLGSGAYRQLSGVLKRSRKHARLVVVYSELGAEFARFAQVLSEVKSLDEPAASAEERELGELYFEWLRTGNERARRRLQAAGILVVRRPGATQ